MPLRDGVSVSGDIGDNKRSIHGKRATPSHHGERMNTVVWVAMETTMTYSSPAAGRQGLF